MDNNFDACHFLSDDVYSVWAPNLEDLFSLALPRRRVVIDEEEDFIEDFTSTALKELDHLAREEDENARGEVADSGGELSESLPEGSSQERSSTDNSASTTGDSALEMSSTGIGSSLGASGVDSPEASNYVDPYEFPMYSAMTLVSSTPKRPKNAQHCRFCKTNGEPPMIYETHSTKDLRRRVTCPILRRHTCEFCGATGDKAHTRKYCPLNDEKPVHLPPYRLLSNGNYSTSHNHK